MTNTQSIDIIIVGAGAAGLMAARELSSAEKKVFVLEARDRIGGRVWSLPEKDFGYIAECGAEFVHGSATLTRRLMMDAGLTFVPEEGEIWNVHGGMLEKQEYFLKKNDELRRKLENLQEDLSITDFLNIYFSGEDHEKLRSEIIRIVRGYDTADPEDVSTFELRDEWLGEKDLGLNEGKIKEGYGALLTFLKNESVKEGVEILLGSVVNTISWRKNSVRVRTEKGLSFSAKKIIVTVPLPVIPTINFEPAIDGAITAASNIGFGNVIKIILRFEHSWWYRVDDKDMSRFSFVLAGEGFSTWWTQYPNTLPILTGYMGGPISKQYKNASDEELLEMALDALVSIFGVQKEVLQNLLVYSKVLNWVADPFTRGAYSYTSVRTKNAYKELAKPIENTIFFAGEALHPGTATATVESALGSGEDVASKILEIEENQIPNLANLNPNAML